MWSMEGQVVQADRLTVCGTIIANRLTQACPMPSRDTVTKSSRATRIAFAIAAMTLVVALALHMANWYRAGAANWPAAGNMAGLLVLMATGVFDPPPGPLRLGLTLMALALIVPSAYFLVMH